MSIELADVVNSANIRMRDQTAETDFADELLDVARISGDTCRHEFQRGCLPKLQIIRSIDLAHPPLPISDTMRYRRATTIRGRKRRQRSRLWKSGRIKHRRRAFVVHSVRKL